MIETPQLLLSEFLPLLSDPLAALADQLADLAGGAVILRLPHLIGRACILGRGQVTTAVVVGICFILAGDKEGRSCGGDG